MSDRIGNLAAVISASTDPLQKDLDRAGRMLDQFDRRASKSKATPRADAGRYAAGLRDVGYDPLSRHYQRSHSEFADRTAPARSNLVTAGLAAGVAGAMTNAGIGALTTATRSLESAVVDVTMRSVDLAGQAQQTRMAFDVMTGSAERAGRVIADLKRFAAGSPFSSREVIGNARQLMAFGIEADQLAPTLRMLGDVAAGTGTDLQRIAYAYGQVRTAGRLFGTELKQFTEAGVPIIDALAKVLDKPASQVRDLVEQDRVGFDDVVKAFKVMTEKGGKFDGMTDKLATNYKGRLEQFSDAVERAQVKLGDALIQDLGLTRGLQQASVAVDNLGAAVEGVRPGVRFLGEWGRTVGRVWADGGRLSRAMWDGVGDTIGHLLPELRDMDGIGRDLLAAWSNNMRQLATAADVAAKAIPAIVRNTHPGLRGLNDLIGDTRQKLRDFATFELDPVRFGDVIFDLAGGIAGTVGDLLDGLEATGLAIDEYLIRPFVRARHAIEDTAVQVGVLAKAMRDSTADPVGFAANVAAAGGLGRWLAREVRLATPIRPRERLREQRLVGVVGDQPWPPLNHHDAMLRAVADARGAVMPGLVQMKVDRGNEVMRPIRNLVVDIFEKAVPGLHLLGLAADRAANRLDAVQVPRAVPAHLRELAKRLNDPAGEFADPVARFKRELGEIREAMATVDPVRFDDAGPTQARAGVLGVAGAFVDAQKLVPRDVGLRAMLDVVQRAAADHAGMRLPQGAEIGSTEATRMAAHLAAGSGSQASVPDLLRAMEARLVELIRVGERTEREVSKAVQGQAKVVQLGP